jgi:hypothetical protein
MDVMGTPSAADKTVGDSDASCCAACAARGTALRFDSVLIRPQGLAWLPSGNAGPQGLTLATVGAVPDNSQQGLGNAVM